MSARFASMGRSAVGLIILAACCVPAMAGQPGTDESAKPLWQGYFIWPRSGEQHLCLNDGWRLGWRDGPVEQLTQLDELAEWVPVDLPATVHWGLYRCGELPYPYARLNSRQYEWVEERAWYYRKSFEVPAALRGHYALLCCDGIDYYSRFWLNGRLLGRHEGMYGGPAIEVSQLLRFDGPNELVIEVRSANVVDEGFKKYGSRGGLHTIKGWKLSGGVGAEPWFTLGIWQGVRIEFVPHVHLERPFLITRRATPERAELSLRVEVLAGTHSLGHSSAPKSHLGLRTGFRQWDAKRLSGQFHLAVELLEPETGRQDFRAEFPIQLYEGRNWIERELLIDQPRLWWPNGMGCPHRYRVRLLLLRGGKPIDRLEFGFGIRTIQWIRSAAPCCGDRWGNWQLVVNGRRLFVKGCNWMPADLLLDLPRDRYRWLLEAVREAGIQMLRVWGGGLIETEEFYDLCDELGIMVWQDLPIANRETPHWPQDVWEAQVAWNVFRLRSRPSLVLWCGGNEFNPYSPGNTATIGILERTLAELDGTRVFRRASPDEGSTHTYPDMDPTWYARLYRWLPFMAETGIHCIAEPKGLYEIIDPAEFRDLGRLWDKGFKDAHPEFIHHFVEYEPSRVPRMLSRASHIDRMNDPSLESLAEATQIGAGEFYRLLSEALQGNYPVTTGLMVWVLKRPWPVVGGIMLIDGFGQPVAPYYFLKRTYEPTHVMVALPYLLWAPGESVPIEAKVLHAPAERLGPASITVSVLGDSLQPVWQQRANGVHLLPGPSVSCHDLGCFTIPGDWIDRFFFVVAELRDESGKLISRSVYWPRSLSMLSGPAERAKWRRVPRAWPYFKGGPWLKRTVARTVTTLAIELLSEQHRGAQMQARLRIRNSGDVPAFPVTIDVTGLKRLLRASENYFWLAPGEQRDVTVIIHPREQAAGKRLSLTVYSWNARKKILQLGAN